MKAFNRAGVSALALIAWGTTAHAAPQAAAPAVEAGATDIVVTATKRTQTLQDVPISVSVTSGETLKRANVTDIIDLQTLVPSLKVYQLQNTGQTGFSIRGFGNGTGNAGLEPSVGVFIDGVYRSRSASSVNDLPDVERIEVLRGPQSTLFGKNVSVGAISIVTKAPSFKWGGSAEATLGNYGEIGAKASINVPLSDTVAAKISGSFDQRDGYTRNIGPTGGLINNRDRWSVRGDVLWKPTANFSLRVLADYGNISEICCTVSTLHSGPAAQLIAGPVSAGGLGKITSDYNVSPYIAAYNFLPTNHLVGQGISAEANLTLGFAKLTSITAYRDQKYDVLQDVDFTTADILNQTSSDHYKSFTQEFRLASTGKGPFSWLLGAFYSNEDISTGRNITYGTDTRAFINGQTSNLLTLMEGLQNAVTPSIVPGKTYFQNGQGFSDNWKMKDRTFSLFGQADYKILPKLTLTGGVAYLNDHKAVVSNVTVNDPFAQLNLNNVPQLGFLPFGALPAGVAGCLLQKGFNPASTGGKVPVSLFGDILGASLPGPGSAPCPTSAAGLNPFALGALQFYRPPVNIPHDAIIFTPGSRLAQIYGTGLAAENGILNGNRITFTGRLAYEFNRHFNVYASYSTGWKAGAYNLSSDSTPPDSSGYGRSAQPEKLTVYEIGLKTKFRQGYVNVALFTESVKDFQSNAFTGSGFALTNAGKETTKGVEVDSSFAPIKQLVFGANLTYLEAKYDSFLLAACGSDPQVNPCTGSGGNTVVFHDLTGLNKGDVPKWSASLSAVYTQDFGDGYNAFIRGEYDYSSSFLSSETVPSIYSSVNVNSINGSIGISMPYKLDVTFWVRNLTKDSSLRASFRTVLQSSATGAAAASVNGNTYTGYPSEPRRFGMTIRKAF